MQVKNDGNVKYSNSFGLIYHNQLFLIDPIIETPIDLTTVSSIKLYKKDIGLFNILSFSVGIALVYLLINYSEKFIQIFILILLSIIAFSVAFNLTITTYHLVITKKDYSFITIKIEKNYTNEVREIIKTINKKYVNNSSGTKSFIQMND